MIHTLSDREAQLVVVNNVKSFVSNYTCRKQSGLINDLTVKEFTNNLRNNNYELVYGDSHGVVFKFNRFQIIILRIFEASFLLKHRKYI